MAALANVMFTSALMAVVGAAQDMEASEIGAMLRHPAAGGSVKAVVDAFPRISMEALLQPITRTVVRVQLTITPEFRCEARVPGLGRHLNYCDQGVQCMCVKRAPCVHMGPERHDVGHRKIRADPVNPPQVDGPCARWLPAVAHLGGGLGQRAHLSHRAVDADQEDDERAGAAGGVHHPRV